MDVAVYDYNGTQSVSVELHGIDAVKKRLRGLAAYDPVRGFDLETVGLSPGRGRYVRLMQISKTDGAIVIDVGECGLEPFKEDLEQFDLVAFGAAFEAKWLRAAGISIDRLECSRLLHMATYRRAWGGRDKGGPATDLGTLAEDFLGRPRDKSFQKSNWAGDLTQEQIAYAGQDAVDALDLWKLFAGMATERQITVAYPMLRKAMPCMVWMEETGMHLDFPAHYKLDRRLAKGEKLALKKLQDVAEINWRSSKQVGTWLMEHLPIDQLEKWPKTDGGALSTSAKVLKRKLDDVPTPLRRPFVLKLLYSNRQKMRSTYGTSMHAHLDEKAVLHGSINQGGAVTGRPTSSSPNLLNMPRLPIFRRCFKATKGHKLVIADYAQIEFRVASALAGNDPRMESMFDNREDLHIATACDMFLKDPEDVTSLERQAAKATGFGVLCGMGAPSLSLQLRCSQTQAKVYIGDWLKTFPEIARYRQDSLDETMNGEGLYLLPEFPSGRRVQFLKEPPPSQVYNYPVQGTAAELMYHALGILEPALRETDVVPWIQVYDEIVLCAPDDQAELAAWMLEEAMRMGALKGLPNINMTGIVDAHIGQSWADKS